MSLYNMVMGTNRTAPLVLALLDLTPGDCGRFRDAWVEKNDAGQLRLAVYTRNGGGNREEYQGTFDALAEHPLWIRDEDDDFDCTYATIYFRAPEDALDRVKKLAIEQNVELPADWTLASVAQDAPNMAERWAAVIDAIGKAPTEPSTELPTEGGSK